MDSLGENPIFLIDDSDIIKLLEEKFEDLGIVRDGSSRNKSYEKGYHHKEIVGLTQKKNNQLVCFQKYILQLKKNLYQQTTSHLKE